MICSEMDLLGIVIMNVSLLKDLPSPVPMRETTISWMLSGPCSASPAHPGNPGPAGSDNR